MDVEDIEDFQATDASTGARIIHSLPPVVGRSSRPSSTAAGSCAQPQCSSAHEPSSVPGTQRVWLKTFGCSHNASDSEYMAGLLQAYGYQLVEDAASGQAHLWLINSCTVKNPSQAAMGTLVARAQQLGKAVLVAGCVPQGDRRAKELEGVSLLGGWQGCTPRLSLPGVVLLLCMVLPGLGCWQTAEVCVLLRHCSGAGGEACTARSHPCRQPQASSWQQCQSLAAVCMGCSASCGGCTLACCLHGLLQPASHQGAAPRSRQQPQHLHASAHPPAHPPPPTRPLLQA
jgi:hypothetical protein